MNPHLPDTLPAAEQAVTRLVEECRKSGRVYPHSPKAVAQVSRTGKWLLNAITALHLAMARGAAAEDQASE